MMLQKIIDKFKTECSSCENCKDLKEDEVSGPTPCFKNLHESEKQNFLKLLRQTGRTLSNEEMEVVNEFLTHEGHLSSNFLLSKLAKKNTNISIEKVEEILDLLCRYGLAQKVQLNGTGPWYEHLHIGENHDHLMCTRCGKVVEFYDENLREKIFDEARSHGFDPLFYKTTIYGICNECKAQQGQSLPLTMISPGEKVKIVSFNGGSQLKKKLSEMGLVCGETIEVLGKSGPIILNVKGSRLAIGKGVAQKILVSLES